MRRDRVKAGLVIAQAGLVATITIFAADLELTAFWIAVGNVANIIIGAALLQLAPVGTEALPREEAETLRQMAERPPETRSRAEDRPAVPTGGRWGTRSES
jgi:hypothetical protein